MSTAGKVLSVLVTLMALIWVLLAAGVTQLNRNGAEAVAKIQKQIDTLEVQVAQAKEAAQKVTDDASKERSFTLTDLSRLQRRQADVEGQLALTREIAERVRLQFETVKATVTRAQAESQQRLAEREAETKAKADAEAEVERLKAENKESRDRLAQLRDQFRTALKANREMVERLRQKQQQQQAQPRSGNTRSASLVR